MARLVCTTSYSSNVGCFVDWENVRWSLKNSGLPPADPAQLITLARRVGRVSLARAYGNFQHRELVGQERQLAAAGLTPVWTAQGENCAESIMADDVARWAITASLDATALIASGDEDILPLVRFLQARLVRVILIGVGPTFSRRLSAAADLALTWEHDVARLTSYPSPCFCST